MGAHNFHLHRMFVAVALACAAALMVGVATSEAHTPEEQQQAAHELWNQTQQEADTKSSGCLTCHVTTDSATMHPTGTVRLGCTDCHGGNSQINVPSGTANASP
jgi:hypothetical protein